MLVMRVLVMMGRRVVVIIGRRWWRRGRTAMRRGRNYHGNSTRMMVRMMVGRMTMVGRIVVVVMRRRGWSRRIATARRRSASSCLVGMTSPSTGGRSQSHRSGRRWSSIGRRKRIRDRGHGVDVPEVVAAARSGGRFTTSRRANGGRKGGGNFYLAALSSNCHHRGRRWCASSVNVGSSGHSNH